MTIDRIHDPLAGPVSDPIGEPHPDDHRSISPLNGTNPNFEPQQLGLPPYPRSPMRTYTAGRTEIYVDSSCYNPHCSDWHSYAGELGRRYAILCPTEADRRQRAKAAKQTQDPESLD